MDLSDAQRELLIDKHGLWAKAARADGSGPDADMSRDYNRRAADALKALLSGYDDACTWHAAFVGRSIPDVDWSDPIRFRGYRIYRNDFTAHPDWRSVAWLYVHEDYDGPEDNRSGHAATVEGCIAAIQESEEG